MPFDQDDETTATAFRDTYRRLLESAVAAGMQDLILLEPFLLPLSADQERWWEDLRPKQDAVRELAEEFGARFVPLQEILSAAGAPEELVTDGVHPTERGHQIIAQSWLQAFPR